jgi:hypothetical protein
MAKKGAEEGEKYGKVSEANSWRCRPVTLTFRTFVFYTMVAISYWC